MSTLLAMCIDLSLKLDYEEPVTVVGSIDTEHTRMVKDINRAYRLIWNKFNKKNEDAETTGTITLVSGTEAYNFPSGIYYISQIRQDDSTPPITIIPWPEYERMKAGVNTSVDVGEPTMASIYGRQVYIFPTPGSAGTLNVRGKQGFTALAADASEPDLQDELHGPIFELALYFQMLDENEQMAAAQYQNYLEAMKAAKANMRSARVRNSRIMGPHEQGRLEFIREQTR